MTLRPDTSQHRDPLQRRHISLRQLELFACVVRNQSYSRAASELRLTQPAVSIQIRNLEENIGTPLLEYVGRRLYLTDAGRELYSAATSILDTLDGFAMRLADLQGLKQGRLQVSIVTTAKYFMPRLLGMFCTRFPGIDAEIRVGTRSEIITRLEHNADDLCIMGRPPQRSNMTIDAFMDNDLVLIARKDHALASQRRIPLAHVAQEPFLMREAGSGTRMALEELLAEHGLCVNARMEFASNEAIKQAVLGGLGVAIVSRHALAADVHDGGIVELDVRNFPLRHHWHVVYPAEKHLSVVAQAFRQFLHEQAHAP